jgi:hypothetical protein
MHIEYRAISPTKSMNLPMHCPGTRSTDPEHKKRNREERDLE